MNEKCVAATKSSYSARAMPLTELTSLPPLVNHETVMIVAIDRAERPKVTPDLTPVRSLVFPVMNRSIDGEIRLTMAIE